MYIHVDHRWFKTILKKALSVLLIYSVFFTTYVNAGAAESWTVEKVVYDNVGKNLSYTASRVNALASNDLVYKAKVPVTASATGSTVANMIRLGLAGAAIYALVEGVGWIIENGVVKKLDPDVVSDPNTIPYIWSFGNRYGSDPDALCKSIITTEGDGTGSNPKHLGLEYVSPTRYGCKMRQYNRDSINGYINKIPNPNYNPDLKPSYIPVPDTELGEQVNKVAPQVLPDVYNPNNPAGGAAPEATKRALENANPQPRENPKSDTVKKPNKDTDGDGQPDVYDPAEPDLGETTEWPEACSWFPTICEWYTKYKEDSDLVKEHREAEKDVWLKEDVAREEEKTAREEEKEQRKDEKTFWQDVKDWFDWSKENDDLDDDNEPPEIKDIPIASLDTSTFKGTAGCPSPIQVPVAFAKSGTVEISYEPICAMASKWSFIAPFIGFFSGALIILGVGRKGEDSDT